MHHEWTEKCESIYMHIILCTYTYKICAFNVYMHIDMLRNIYENLFEN